jgi:hypothetical protein
MPMFLGSTLMAMLNGPILKADHFPCEKHTPFL